MSMEKEVQDIYDTMTVDELRACCREFHIALRVAQAPLKFERLFKEMVQAEKIGDVGKVKEILEERQRFRRELAPRKF